MTKTLSFAALHFSVAFTIGWLLTGSWLVGGAIALVEPACNTVVFHFHEKVWNRIEARRGEAPTQPSPACQAVGDSPAYCRHRHHPAVSSLL